MTSTLAGSDLDPRWTWTRRDLATVLLVVLLAVGARWVVIGHAMDRLDDPDGYLTLARSVVAGEGLRINGHPTAYRPPLYPILLAPWVAAWDGASLPRALAWFHLGLGALTVALVADSARRWGLTRLGCGLAAVVVAFDPVLLVQSRAIMTETLAATLTAATLWGFTLRGGAGLVVGGVGFGLASLCRPSFLPIAGFTALIGVLTMPGGWRHRLGCSVILLVTAVVVVAPWAIRNRVAVGEAVWTTTHGGYTLALANNPFYYFDVVNGPPDAVWSGPNQQAWIDSINAATVGNSEPESDRWLRQEAIHFAWDHPRNFLRATLARLGRFWGVMPATAVYSPLVRWAVAAWTVPLWILLLVGLTDRGSYGWPRVVAVAMVVGLTSVHTIYWTDLRMRAPVVPAVALIAAAGLVRSRRQRVWKDFS